MADGTDGINSTSPVMAVKEEEMQMDDYGAHTFVKQELVVPEEDQQLEYGAESSNTTNEEEDPKIDNGVQIFVKEEVITPDEDEPTPMEGEDEEEETHSRKGYPACQIMRPTKSARSTSAETRTASKMDAVFKRKHSIPISDLTGDVVKYLFDSSSDEEVTDIESGNELFPDSNRESEASLSSGEEDNPQLPRRSDTSTIHTIPTTPQNIPFTSKRQLQTYPDELTPIGFFRLLLDDSILDIIVEETNAYAEMTKEKNTSPKARITRWYSPLTKEELLVFLGLTFHTGTIRLPRLCFYWTKKTFRKGLLHMPCFSTIMSRDRYMLILQCLHFARCSTEQIIDKLYKIRPLIDYFNNKIQTIFSLRYNLCIDESMVLWRGRLSFHHDIQTKRHNDDLKLYMLTERSGLALKFFLYPDTGYQSLGNQGHAAKGETIQRFTDKGICFMKWKDKREVLMSPSKTTGDIVDVAEQSCVVSKKQLLSYYPCGHKTLKWYQKLAFHIFHLILMDSFFLLSSYSGQRTKPDLVTFRLDLCESLVFLDYPNRPKPPRPSPGPYPFHYLEETERAEVRGGRKSQLRCRNCSQKNIKKLTTLFCAVCPEKVGLCVSCFREYHEKNRCGFQ